MKILSAFLIVLVPTLASKEYAEDISQLLDNPDLILELVKRLGSNPKTLPSTQSFPEKHSNSVHRPHVPVVHGDSRSCKTRQFKKTIIRTDDSRKAGATFLSFTENVASNTDCLSKCCSKKGCDLAVYENKTKHNCYLFKCQDAVTGENKCQFDNHADYISTTLSTAREESGRPAGTPATGTLGVGGEDSLGASLEKVTEDSKSVPTKHKPTPRPTPLPHTVALGRWCRLDVSCEDPHAVCYQDTCQCQQHFQPKNGICREICGPERVACERRGTARVGPDCIPHSQVCDGTTQCADGSDERDCKGYPPAGSPPSKTSPQDQWEEKPSAAKDGDSTSSEDSLQAVSEVKLSKTKTESADPTQLEPATETEDETDPNQHQDRQETGKQPDNNVNTQTTEEDLKPEESKPGQDSSKLLEPEVQSQVPGDVQSSTAAPLPPPHKIKVMEEEEVFVTKEKVIVTSPTDGAQGPIVALSLGLAITLMLLVFVGCRLRNVRHRLRKGRPLHSNEADYLINGMYL